MKQLMDKTETMDYVVEPFQEDFTGRLSWSVLGRKILATAGAHADNRGFGIKQLLPRGYSWVLARLKIEMDTMPRLGDPYRVETWIHSVYHTFTDRCFAIVHPQTGKAYGYAYSTWAMIHFDTRRAVNLEDLPDGGIVAYADAEKACPVSPFRPVRMRGGEDEFSREVDVLYNDLDVNRHTNSIRYIEHILDLFPASLYEAKRVRSVEMYYRGEAYYGDRLRLTRLRQAVGEYAVSVDKLPDSDKGETKPVSACLSRVIFE